MQPDAFPKTSTLSEKIKGLSGSSLSPLDQWGADGQNTIGAGTLDLEASYSFEEGSDDSCNVVNLNKDGLMAPPIGNQFTDEDKQAILEDTFLIYGKPARVQLTPSCIVIRALEPNRKLQNLVLPAAGGPSTFVVPIDDVISTNILTFSGPCTSSRIAGFNVMTYRRGRSNPADWLPLDLEFESDMISTAGKWVQYLNRLVQQIPDRPKHLLVIINPYGGSKRAREVWTDTVEPLLRQAGVSYYSFETQHSGHAREYVESISRAELLRYDGVVGVGGDGLFQELINGLLTRHKDITSRPPEVGPRLRLCQIPGGSTDAVACSTNGTRSAVAATLHVVLGDRMPMDVMKVESLDGHVSRYATCMASYGFMGDLMRKSEGMRWMGPLRYDVAGAVTFLAASSYAASISYRRAAPVPPGMDYQTCKTACELCSSARSSELGTEEGGSHADADGGASSFANLKHKGEQVEKGSQEAGVGGTQVAGTLSPPMQADEKPHVGSPAPRRGLLARFSTPTTPPTGAAGSAALLRAVGDAFSFDETEIVRQQVSRSNSRRGVSFTLQKVDEHPNEASAEAKPSPGDGNPIAAATEQDVGVTIACRTTGREKGGQPVGPARMSLQPLSTGAGGDDVSEVEDGGEAWDTQDLPSTARARMLQDAVMYIRQGSGSQWTASSGGGQADRQKKGDHVCGEESASEEVGAGSTVANSHRNSGLSVAAPGGGQERHAVSDTGVVDEGCSSCCQDTPPQQLQDDEGQPEQQEGEAVPTVSPVGIEVPDQPVPASPFQQIQASCQESDVSSDPPNPASAAPLAGAGAQDEAPSPPMAGSGETQVTGPIHDETETDTDAEQDFSQQLPYVNYRPYVRSRALSSASIPASYVSQTNEPHEVVHGDFQALMCAVTPCRSDKSKGGVIPYAHLADGRLHLVMVKKCSRVQFLRFLVHMSSHGVDDKAFDYVDVKHVTEFTVQPNGKESTWNVDGELVSNCGLRVRACRGLIDVFSRGVDM